MHQRRGRLVVTARGHAEQRQQDNGNGDALHDAVHLAPAARACLDMGSMSMAQFSWLVVSASD